MKKVILTYVEPTGDNKKIEVYGDFQVGRQKTERGPMITFLLENGDSQCLTNCPRTISRLKISPQNECGSCHARFFWDGDKLYIQDMGSTNGTSMNGKYLSGWEKRKKSDNVEINSASQIKLGDFDINIEPIVEKHEPNPILKRLGLDPVLGNAQGNGSSPIIINIQNLDAGTHKNIGSIDVVANRSNVDIDGDDDTERDIMANRSDVRSGKLTEVEEGPIAKKKKKYHDIEFDEDV